MKSKERPVGTTPISRAWMSLVEQVTPEEVLAEGFEYGGLGQVAAFTPISGGLEARVQGRQRRPYDVKIRIPTFTSHDWDRLAEVLAQEAGAVAALIDGRVPDTVVSSMHEMSRPLLPRMTDDVEYTCSCLDLEEDDPQWRSRPCKHGAALAFVVAEHLDNTPMSAFIMRGIEEQMLLDRLRLHRLAESGGGTAQAVHDVDLHEMPSKEPVELELSPESFWQVGPDLKSVTDELVKSDGPRHALLRRLGQSPFSQGNRFPMVGLLATCYDIISERAVQEQLGDLPDEISGETGDSDSE